MLKLYKVTSLLFIMFCFQNVLSQNLEKVAQEKIKALEKLVKKAEKKSIDVLKEKTTIRTAEVFLKFANWDEKHIDVNTKSYELVSGYKMKASKMADDLPNFERNDVVLMLDEAIDYLKLLINKEVYRKSSPNVNWKYVNVEGDQLTYNKRPVFLADYTWKPRIKALTEYHGNQDGFFLTPSYVSEADGSVNPRIIKELDEKTDGSLGFIFLNHKNVPKWAVSEYGKDFHMRKDTYTAYDIDHPGAKYIQKNLLGAVVPKMAGKKYTKLGYMLCNEPHFFTQKDGNKKVWASGPVSQFTIDKFKIWLQEKHKNIDVLNQLWETSFSSFNDVSIQIPIEISLKGSPKWYDWTVFNMYRVTEWYKFLKAEIQKHDKEAKVHLKIMPNLWTENERIHGIDLEALTNISGIVGNDSGAEHKRLFGKPHEWEKHYAFEWRELCMGYDFMKSVAPNKINFNSELHYLSTGRSRDLHQDPKYARAAFWLAHSYGMTASQIWYWPRKADGAVTDRAGKGYGGSNNQQPRITNEVAMTLIDLNAYSEEIMSMQRQRKPLRIFYSKTSAINKKEYMDDLFELYESLHFEGTPLGFVSKDIINNQKNSNWDAVLIYKTPFVTLSELKAIQKYLDNGGIVYIDNESLKHNEYGNAIPQLKVSKGKLIKVNSIDEAKEKALQLINNKGLMPEVVITESSNIGKKTVIWKVVKNKAGNNVLSAVNIGNKDVTINVLLKGSDKVICKDLLKGIEVNSNPTLKPNELFFIEVKSNK